MISEQALLQVMRDARERAKLALQIATVASVELVDSCSLDVERDGEKWRDLSDWEFDYLAELHDELRFLELCGRLRRHPREPKLVRLVEPEVVQ